MVGPSKAAKKIRRDNMNSTKFKIIGISNGIAYLRTINDSFKAFADDAKYIGNVGETVEVLEKDYTPEGNLAAYQEMSDRYNADDKEGDGNRACLDGQN